MSDRRREPRERQAWQPHPDQVRECMGVWEFYGCGLDPDMPIEDVMRRVLVAAKGWQDRWDAEEARAKNAYVRALPPDWR